MKTGAHFTYRDDQLFAERCALAEIAERYDTPCYVYSRTAIVQNWERFDQACKAQKHRICYAVKANSNLAVLNVLARLGSGFDIVSGGELARVLAAGGKADGIVFSGVGKQDAEIKAALEAEIGCFNVESHAELFQINTIAKSLGKTAPIALRINPNIPIETHPYIATGLKESKFGLPYEEALALYAQAKNLENIEIKGMACHLGSQIMTVEPYLIALEKLLFLIDQLAEQQIILSHIDLGGGFGVSYTEDSSPDITAFLCPLLQKLATRNLTLLLEPGRAIMASAGILLTRVLSLKAQSGKHFAIVDAGMNDLIRPALYDAWHEIMPVQQVTTALCHYDVVGPVCETGDFLGIARELSLEPGALVAVKMAGAYGFVMSSNYNSRPRPAEVMVADDKSYLIRARETVEQLFASELCLP